MFPDLLREPDFVTGAVENTEFRFEENRKTDCPVQYEFIVDKNSAKIIVHPSGEPVKYLRLRFSADLSFVDGVCGDAWMACGSEFEVYWSSLIPQRNLPWYFYMRAKERIACYGVKTGADCFAFWRVDSHGITLFLNLTSGSGGTDLKESIIACEIVQYIAPEEQNPYMSACTFAKMMCENPNLPNEPIMGMNDWYCAYGSVTQDFVMKELDILKRITNGLKHRPYLVIDDGWQLKRVSDEKKYYIGGPWISSKKFGDIEKTAEIIKSKGVKPGIWFRSLLADENKYDEALLRIHDNGFVLDPTHPYTQEYVISNVSMLKNYGFEFIKHDFSTYDILGAVPNNSFGGINLMKDSGAFYDNTKTTATVLKNLYSIIQTAAKGALVMGCGTVPHLSAGIHQISRVGVDTSGRVFDWTIRNGGNAFMRLPQNKSFHIADIDCAAFTEKVPFEENLNFLKLCAMFNTVTMASITPGLLTDAQFDKIADAFRIADSNNNEAYIENFEKVTIPDKFIVNGRNEEINWYNFTNGTRIQVEWKN